jgi:hypothetical protein
MHTAGTISFRIWMTAIIINTVVGTMLYTQFREPLLMALGVLFFGFLLTGLFSLPVYLVIGSLIAKLRSSGASGLWALFCVYAVGLACTLAVHCCLMLFIMDDFFFTEKNLLRLNLFSAALGITVQAHRIFKISTIEPE